MGATGWKQFTEDLRQWWPILACLVALAITGTVTTSSALAAIQQHERRLDAVERVQTADSMRLKVIEVQTDSTSRTVNRMEDKLDRWSEERRK